MWDHLSQRDKLVRLKDLEARWEEEDEPVIHPYARIYGTLHGEQLLALAEDIERQGMLEPITLYDELGRQDHHLRILDGRARFTAACLVDVEPSYVILPPEMDPLAFVASKNGQRLHAKPIQLGMAATRLAKFRTGRPPKSVVGEADIVEIPTIKMQRFTQEQAGRQAGGVSRDTVNKCRRINDQGSANLIRLADNGDISIGIGHRLAKYPQDLQDEILAAIPVANLSERTIDAYLREEGKPKAESARQKMNGPTRDAYKFDDHLRGLFRMHRKLLKRVWWCLRHWPYMIDPGARQDIGRRWRDYGGFLEDMGRLMLDEKLDAQPKQAMNDPFRKVIDRVISDFMKGIQNPQTDDNNVVQGPWGQDDEEDDTPFGDLTPDDEA